MPTEILISSDPWENRVAIREDGTLAEIYFEREEKVIGSIYKGKAMNVLPGMGASFIDIGLGRNAFLYVDDINKTPLNIGDVEITQGRSGWTITEKISKGDDVLCQIVKEPRGLKGARISTNISLPGRYLILMPTGKFSGVSRKIETAEERNRLKTIMKMIRPPEMATVVRTAAAGVSQSELIADLGVLIRMWHGILESYKRAQAPALIHKDMNLVFKAARDFITPEVDRVLIDDKGDFEKVRDFMRLLGPQYVDRIEYYNNGRSLFADFHIDEEVQKLLRPTVKLPSGGSIVIETTEALTVIDVNSGKFTGGKNLEDTIVRTNVEAAAEIARQVRLRDIGGIIVCDFIDMGTEHARTRVIETLKNGLQKDRTRSTIQSFSTLGLLEFTRKRVGKDLSGQLRGACPTCAGIGSVMSPESVAIEAFREIRRFGHEHRNGATERKALEIVSAPTVGAQIEYWYEDELADLERELDTTIAVRVDAALHPEKTRLEALPDVASATAPPSNVRVGDELDVDLVRTKLPIATSGLAVVGDRLVEVENAANSAGETVKIKVIDIDEDGTILAEPRTVAAPVPGETKKRRRRGGRGRGTVVELTPAEQEEQLRDLAEEAAKGLDGRPALGISTEAEAEAEDTETRADVAAAAAAVAAASAPTDGAIPEYAAVDASGEGRAYASYGGPDEGRKKRRRRRRRRGPGDAPVTDATAIAAPLTADADAGDTEDDAELEGDEVAAAGDATVAPVAEETTGKRRKRRRRRRGRGGAPDGTVPDGLTDQPGDAPAEAVPERTIFRVDGRGTAEPTGKTAPREPSRAVAHRERSGPVAVDAPPPSLSAPTEPEEQPRFARPTRRRRVKADDVDSEPIVRPALPGAVEPTGKPPAREPEPVAAEAPAPVAESPKRRGRSLKSETDAAASAALSSAVETAAFEPAVSEPPVAEREARAVEPVAQAPAAKPTRGRKPKALAPAPEPEPRVVATPQPELPLAASDVDAAEEESEDDEPMAMAPPARGRKKATASARPPAAKKSPAKKTAAKKATAKKAPARQAPVAAPVRKTPVVAPARKKRST